MISVHNLKYWRCGPMNFSIDAGECLCISGPSGAGKTLLLRALADLDPHEGDVYLNGRECQKIPPHEWRQQIGMIPAEVLWWYPLVGEHFSSIDNNWLAFLGFHEDVMGWEVKRLSMGERARLGLLRTLSNHPHALLLDEPTANLDEKNTLNVEAFIKKYQEEANIPILWITHKEEQKKRVGDRSYVLENGILA